MKIRNGKCRSTKKKQRYYEKKYMFFHYYSLISYNIEINGSSYRTKVFTFTRNLAHGT